MPSIEPPFQPGEIAVVVLSDHAKLHLGDEVTVIGFAPLHVLFIGMHYEIVTADAMHFYCKHKALKRRREPPRQDWIKLCHLTPRITETA